MVRVDHSFAFRTSRLFEVVVRVHLTLDWKVKVQYDLDLEEDENSFQENLKEALLVLNDQRSSFRFRW